MTAEEIIHQLKTSAHRMPLQRPVPWQAEWAAVLRSGKASQLFAEAASPAGAQSGALLHLGCWDDAHQVAQDLETPDGSYWHAIIHRQEPDSFNSGYWFRRVGQHPIFPQLARAAAELGYPASGTQWDPTAFIDFCESATGASATVAIEVQHAEWRLLLEWCLRQD